MSLLDRLPPRIVMTAATETGTPVPDIDARAVTPEDLPPLAQLLVVAYAGTVDDLQQTPAEALAELDDFCSGRMLGPMVWDCSFLSPSEGAPRAVVLTAVEKDRPLLGYIYTHPDCQGRGLATGLISRAREALADRGETVVTLKVALANDNARRLYERLGFVPE